MTQLFLPTHYALIQSVHWLAACARLADLQARIDGGLNARAGEDGEEDSGPWWKKVDLWGDPLPAPYQVGNVAVIPIKGVITSGMPAIFRAIHWADTEEIGGWVRAAAADPDVERIVLKIDSPGGMVTGTPELAEEVAAADDQKQVDAHTKGMIASAAYWVASQAGNVWCTASSDVGCVGVYQMSYDYTGMLEQFGVKARMFKDGALKGSGHPHVEMSDEQAAHIQSQISAIGEQFRAAVKSKRTMIPDDALQGQSFIGTQAAEMNMVAGLRSFESLL